MPRKKNEPKMHFPSLYLGLIATFCLISTSHNRLTEFSKNDRISYREKIRSMFYEAYGSYVKNAIDYDELMPISCSGMNTWGTFSLSLIDALDMLAIMDNYTEFRRVAQHILDTADFETNTNVSVFETNIRVVGGLLSAHLFSKRAGFQVEDSWPCSGPLLRLAEKVARKLLPAFETPTGMPYGTVNFQYGVPENETPVTCTAGVGTFIVEFGTLSRLTGDPIFEQRALNALEGLQQYRSKIGLLGNHINVQTGKWTATDAGIGAGVDSYFEYLVKGSMLLQMPSLIDVFYYDYNLIKNYLEKDDWYIWVNMVTGSATMAIFQSLEAFFPGLLTLVGDLDQAKKSLYNYHQVWKQYGFVPEFYDIVNGKHHKREGYPLRPEFIESVFYLYRATKDVHLLAIGADVADSIYYSARTECGYATIKSVSDHTLEDRMESFFLAETLKYLYLLFDEDNFINENGSTGSIVQLKDPHSLQTRTCVTEAGGYVFNTEAHPIDIAALACCHRIHSEQPEFFDDTMDLYEMFVRKPNHGFYLQEDCDLKHGEKVFDLKVEPQAIKTEPVMATTSSADHSAPKEMEPSKTEPGDRNPSHQIETSFGREIQMNSLSQPDRSDPKTSYVIQTQNETHCTQTSRLVIQFVDQQQQQSLPRQSEPSFASSTVVIPSIIHTAMPSISQQILVNNTIVVKETINMENETTTESESSSTRKKMDSSPASSWAGFTSLFFSSRNTPLMLTARSYIWYYPTF